MKVCKDCKHVERNDLGLVAADAKCLHPDAPIRHVDIVTGDVTIQSRSARDMRTNGVTVPMWTIDLNNNIIWCGKDAALFEDNA